MWVHKARFLPPLAGEGQDGGAPRGHLGIRYERSGAERRTRVRARTAFIQAFATAACPHPGPPPQAGEGDRSDSTGRVLPVSSSPIDPHETAKNQMRNLGTTKTTKCKKEHRNGCAGTHPLRELRRNGSFRFPSCASCPSWLTVLTFRVPAAGSTVGVGRVSGA